MNESLPGACAITGASGYVGSLLMRELTKYGPTVALTRHPKTKADVAWTLGSEPGLATELKAREVKTLIHAAWDMQASSLKEMEDTCVHGSKILFDAANRAGVERIIFISTISAFEGCRSAYGKSKLMVEKALQGTNNVVMRPGLIFGDQDGGVFGGIRQQIRKQKFVPMIGDGTVPQYLLHQETMVETIMRASRGEFLDSHGHPITVAHPEPLPFRDLIRDIAQSENRSVTLIPLPWRLVYAGLRMGEMVGLRLPFRSDSVISFVNYDRQPDFSKMHAFGIVPIPYKTNLN
jgi:nucleoside-diphosphate-sugar epimerase